MITRPALRIRAASQRRTRGVIRRGAILVAVALAVAAIATLTGCSRLKAPELTNEPKNLFASAKPATVLVVADFKARITVPEWRINEEKVTSRLLEMMESGELAPDDEVGGVLAIIHMIIDDPMTYLEPDTSLPRQGVDVAPQATGSGFIVDPKGYVVTNAHVAAPKDEELRQELAAIGLDTIMQQDAEDLAQGSELPQDLQTQLLKSLEKWYVEHLKIEQLEKKVSVVEGANIPGVETTNKFIPAQVVAAGESVPGKDVAIMKIDKTNLPSLALGDDAACGTGDSLYVVGYPADATFHPALSVESISEPSFTGGRVSAKKQASKGFEVIQTDASTAPGNSGGPVLDKDGRVVGILTFGTIDPATGERVQGFNFVMPTAVIKEFLDRAGAHPGEGTFSRLYREGLQEEAASHNKHALEKFRQVDGISPGHPYVQQRISFNEEAVAAGKDKSLNAALVVGIPAAVLVAVALVGVGLMLFMRRNRAPSPAEAGAAEPVVSYADTGTRPTDAPRQVGFRPPQDVPPPTGAPATTGTAQSAPPRAAAPTQPMAGPGSGGQGAPTTQPLGQSQAPSAHHGDETLDEIRKLSELHDAGVLTDEEFQQKKRQLLDSIT